AADPTLRFLEAFGMYMTGREAAAMDKIARLHEDDLVDSSERLYRRILNLRAIINVELGDLRDANDLLTQLEILSELANDNRFLAYATLNRGITMEMAGYSENAIYVIERAKLAFQKMGDFLSLAA